MRTGPAEQDNTASGPQPLIALLGFCVGCRPPSVGNGCAEPPKAIGSSWREPDIRLDPHVSEEPYSQML